MKPTEKQVREWLRSAQTEADSDRPVVQIVAELAAKWGAEQERAGWLKENAPGGWIDDLRKQAQQTTVEEPELPEAVAWAFYFEDGEISNELFDTREAAEKWLASDDCLWAGSIKPLFAAAQMQSYAAAKVREAMAQQSQDAKRYRWLADGHRRKYIWNNVLDEDVKKGYWDIEQAIDAAMQGDKQ